MSIKITEDSVPVVINASGDDLTSIADSVSELSIQFQSPSLGIRV